MEEFEITKSRVMVIFAHPDDAESAAGGSISKFAQAGSQISIINVAVGDKGNGDSRQREKESLNAAKVLGAELYESLGYNDGEFDNNLKLREELTHRIREFKPDVVICPDPTATFFSHAYVNHRDHRETGWAVIDVVSSAVNNPKYFPLSNAHHVPHLLCAGTQEPNCYVDIEEQVKTKTQAVLCHESQVGNQVEQVENSISDASAVLLKSRGVNNAEVFRYSSLAPEQV